MVGSQKPSVPVTLNYGHPLADLLIGCFVINDGGGPIRDLVTGNVLAYNGVGARAFTRIGESLDCSGGNDAGAAATSWSRLRSPYNGNKLSILWRGLIQSAPSAFAMLAGVTFTNADTTPFQAYTIERDTTAAKYRLSWNSGGTANSLEASPVSAWDGTERQIVGTIRGGSVGSACKLMEGPNAVVIGSSTANSGPNYNANSRVGIGVYQAASGRNSKSIAQHVYFWNRNLEQAEAQQLYVEPYAFLRPLRKYHFTTAVAPATAVFRRTLSEFGARTGARQVMA